MLNKDKLYIDKQWEFYIGYVHDEECWMLVSIPGVARVIADSKQVAHENPITVSEIEIMLDKGIVTGYSARLGDGTWSMIFNTVDKEIEKARRV